ncbi:MAG: hypothetical protein GYA66_12130 [Phyllobacteriaceae bacterium]|nr:hypothetical protein [Phyllobacteriaceae bacterium]
MRSVIVAASLFLASPALAGFDSVYTDFILDKCQRVTPETSGEDGESSGVFECKGQGKYVVTFVEGDLRSFVSFGTETADHCSFHQTFSGFNSVGNKIEWRRKNGKPIATILRWTVSYDPENSEKTKTWLVVTKLGKNDSCHMGYVEGATPNANEKARALADAQASGFSCATSKPIFIANSDTKIDGIASDGCPR